MQPIRFDPKKDLAPIPFDEDICRLAADLKELGLDWRPHVGCFVWDPHEYINAESPFPSRIYFVLSLPRFLDIFGNVESMVEKLVWLPTWHQTRLICNQLGVTAPSELMVEQPKEPFSPAQDLKFLYKRIADTLKNRLKKEKRS